MRGKSKICSPQDICEIVLVYNRKFEFSPQIPLMARVTIQLSQTHRFVVSTEDPWEQAPANV